MPEKWQLPKTTCKNAVTDDITNEKTFFPSIEITLPFIPCNFFS